MFRGAAGLCFLFIACTSVSHTGSKLSTVEGFCQKWAEAACNDLVAERCAADTIDDCVAGASAACEARMPEKKFKGTNAKACLDAVKKAFEDAQLDVPERDVVVRLAAPCDQLLSGSGEGGDPCDEDSDCNRVEGFACVYKTPSAPGECRKPLAVGGGGDCTPINAVCDPGYYCNGENCIVGKSAGAECSADVPCKEDYLCQAQAAGDAGADSGVATAISTCVSKAALSDDCSADADCQSDMCDISAGLTAGKCARVIVLSTNEPICQDLR